MTAFSEPMVHDELEGVVSALCTRFPNRSRSDIEDVVARVFANLQRNATVTAHLIPLTLNRSRRLLNEAGHSALTGTTHSTTAPLSGRAL